MPESFPGPAGAAGPAADPSGGAGLTGCGLPALAGGDGAPGLAGVVDLGDLAGILNAARAADEAAGDPLGEDLATAMAADADADADAVGGAGERWPAAEVAAAAAEGMAPGAGLAYWAMRFEPGQLSDYALPGAAAACRRLASWAQATELALVAEVAARAAVRDSSVPVGPGGLPASVPEEAAAEIALALRLSQHGASAWTDLAITLAGRLAETSAALAAGAIDLTKARLIAEATSVLDDRCAKLAQDKVLPAAGAKTPAQLRAALRRAVISVDPDAAERRRHDAERRAKVGLYGDEDGTATLSGQNLPGAHAAAAMARVTALARAMKSAGAVGGIDLLRAQVYIGLLLGTLPLIAPPEDAPPDDPHDASGDPGGHGGPNDPRECDEAAGPRDSDGPSDADAASEPGGPSGPCEARGQDDPRDPSGHGDAGDPGLADPGDPGPADPDDRAGSDSQGCPGADRQCRARDPAWPALPVPGQVPARLGPSGTGALAGLPRGPASTGLLRLIVPWRTLAGLLAEPGQLSRLGPITPQIARHLAAVAAADRRTEWKIIITDGAGQAIATTRLRRARARAPGISNQPSGLISQVALVVPASLVRDAGCQAPGQPAGSAPSHALSSQAQPGQAQPGQAQPGQAQPGQAQPGQAQPGQARPGHGEPGQAQPSHGEPGDGELSGPSPSRLSDILAAALQEARLATARADADARAAGMPAAGPGQCAHRQASPSYRPPPRLREYVAARDQTCRSPICRQPAHRADLDHTIPHDQGGRTCSCNLGGTCRTHHRLKQRPGWHLAQPEPGTFVWTTPARRTYTQTPDTYPA